MHHHTRLPVRARRAFTLLELQVAFIVFGFALAGLYPLVIMQSKQLTKIESRFNPATTYYLTPSSDEWARKLGATATRSATDPGPNPPPPVLLIDNGDTGYAETGADWQDNGTARTHSAGTGANTAVWQFTGLKPGWYEVRVTWPAATGRATNGAYKVYDGSIARGSYTVNQTMTPLGDAYQSRAWQSLATVAVRGTTLRVELSDNANAIVVADAMRILPVRNTLLVTSVASGLTSEEVTASATLTVVTPQ